MVINPWIPGLIGGGLSLAGNILGARSANRQSNFQRDLIESEMRRRNAVQGAMAPNLLANAGYRNPQQIQQVTGALRGTGPSGAGNPSSVPATPGARGSKVLGGVSAGMGGIAGVSGLLGLTGGLAGPIGLAAGGAALAANKIGQGRRTANSFVDAVERPLGQQLAEFAKGGADPQAVQQAIQNYRNQANAWIGAGGNQAKVAKQSLNNEDLQKTIQVLSQQYGVQ